MKKVKKYRGDVLDSLEAWCAKHQRRIIAVIIAVFSLFSLLLFNIRVSEGGDDSTYIIRAANFISQGAYPSFQGPFYPLFLSCLVAIFGINLGVLKLSSFVIMVLSIWFFYRFFRNRFSYTLLFAMLLLLSVSSYFVYFTSQTYSEALFIFLQLPVFTLVFSIYEDQKPSFNWTRLLGLSAVILAGYLTRTVGIGTLIAVVVFLMVIKKHKEAGIVTGGFILLFFTFLIIKASIWQNGFFEDGQASTLFYKHPYQLELGKETFGGFLMRFIDNSNLYLSKHFLKMVGLRTHAINSTTGGLTLLLYAIFTLATLRAFKKDKYLLFIGIYLTIMLGITFLVLHKMWDQYRLIIPFFPYMILVLLYGLWIVVKNWKIPIPTYMFLILIGIGVISSASRSFSQVDLMTLRKNIRGDVYEGYTEDWKNYLTMAEYASVELSEDNYVAVRKPNMAQIYGNGKKFYGIYRYDTEDPDKLLARLQENGVTHVIMASLRKNPHINNGMTINTIQRYLYLIVKKYPQAFKLVHQIGGQVEPAFLFKVDYEAVKTQRNATKLTNTRSDES